MTRHTDQLQQAHTDLGKIINDLPATRRVLATNATAGIPAVDYDRPGGRAATTPDPTGEAACNGPDPLKQELAGFDAAIRNAIHSINTLVDAHANNNPGRAVTILCPQCQHSIPDGLKECRRHPAAPPPRECSNCGDQMATGKPLRNGRCNACDITWRTQGRERITSTRLELEEQT